MHKIESKRLGLGNLDLSDIDNPYNIRSAGIIKKKALLTEDTREFIEMYKSIVSQVNTGQDQDCAYQQGDGYGFTQEKERQEDGTYGDQVDEKACPGGTDIFDALVVPDKSKRSSKDAEKQYIAPVVKCIAAKICKDAIHDGWKEK